LSDSGPFRKSAEAAFERADVGVVDVAVDDERDVVADELLAQIVGDLNDRIEVSPRALKRVVSSSRSKS